METTPTNSYEEQLRQLRADFDEFTYIVSHDLKAPVRAISNLSTWIEEDLGTGIPESVQQQMALLRNRAGRLEQMMDAILKFSRAGTHNLEIEETDVAKLIKAESEKLAALGEINLNTTGTLPVLFTYKEKLRFIVAELLQNTANFSNSRPISVTVSVTEEDAVYRFEFADKGGGVPDATLDKLFNLFYTVAPKDNVNTTGAGLAIAKKTVQVAGGTMWAENNSQGGLSVFFTWPKKSNDLDI